MALGSSPGPLLIRRAFCGIALKTPRTAIRSARFDGFWRAGTAGLTTPGHVWVLLAVPRIRSRRVRAVQICPLSPTTLVRRRSCLQPFNRDLRPITPHLRHDPSCLSSLLSGLTRGTPAIRTQSVDWRCASRGGRQWPAAPACGETTPGPPPWHPFVGNGNQYCCNTGLPYIMDADSP